MLTLEMMRNNVRTSAVLLDSEVPSWHDKINTEKLDMMSFANCICGQLGIGAENNPDDPDECNYASDTLDMSYTRGFFIDDYIVATNFDVKEVNRIKLKEWWLEEIAQRKQVENVIRG